MRSLAFVACAIALSNVAPIASAKECSDRGLAPLQRFAAQSGNVTFKSDPVLAANADGRLEVFAIGSDGGLWHAWQPRKNDNAWSEWFSFGHPPGVVFEGGWGNGTPVTREPRIAVAMVDGRLHAFVANNQIWEIAQVVPNANWGSWQPLNTAPILPRFGSVWAGQNQDGRLEVFFANRANPAVDARLYHIWHAADKATWSTPAEFGWPGPTPMRDLPEDANTLAVATDKAGRITVASIQDDVVYVRRQADPNSGWQAGWTSLGTPPQGAVKFLTDRMVSMRANPDGRLELVVYGNSGVWDAWQTVEAEWSGAWARIGHPLDVQDVTLARGKDACLVVIANVAHIISGGLDGEPKVLENRLHVLYQRQSDSGGWGTWKATEPGREPAGGLVAHMGPDQTIEVFVRGANETMLHTTER